MARLRAHLYQNLVILSSSSSCISIMAANFGSQRQTGCHIEGESIVAGNGLLKLSFRRTVRVPDDAKTALMPGDMGTFPLYSKSDIRSRASRPYTSADFFFPMYGKIPLEPAKDVVLIIARR